MRRVLKWFYILKLLFKYRGLARKLIVLYKRIEKDYELQRSQRGRKHAQALKRAAWNRRLRNMLELYHKDRYPPSQVDIGTMREDTWDAMNTKKRGYIDYKIGNVDWEDAL